MSAAPVTAWIEDAPSMSSGGFWVWGQHSRVGGRHAYRNVWEDGTPVNGYGGEWIACPFCEVEDGEA